MADIINSFSQTPDILFALKFLSEHNGNTLPALYGFKQGLEGLISVLFQQRSRETSRRTTEIVTHLIGVLTKKPFIATLNRWQKHTKQQEELAELNNPFDQGVLIRRFKAKLPSNKWTSLIPINLDIKGGTVKILKADSGTGKSITIMALQHLLEHEGDLYFVRDGKTTNVHSLENQEALAEEFVLVTKEGMDIEDRIVDLFKKYFMLGHQNLFNSYFEKALSVKDKENVQLAFLMADNLLEKEISTIEDLLKPYIKQKPVEGVFSPSTETLSMLKDIRTKRNQWVKDHLIQQGGNLAAKGVDATRTLSGLSPGELRRLLITVADAACMSRQRAIIILDEPVKDVDLTTNLPLQIKAIKKLQERNPNTAILIITHEHDQELQQNLSNCEIVNLETEEN